MLQFPRVLLFEACARYVCVGFVRRFKIKNQDFVVDNMTLSERFAMLTCDRVGLTYDYDMGGDRIKRPGAQGGVRITYTVSGTESDEDREAAEMSQDLDEDAGLQESLPVVLTRREKRKARDRENQRRKRKRRRAEESKEGWVTTCNRTARVLRMTT